MITLQSDTTNEVVQIFLTQASDKLSLKEKERLVYIAANAVYSETKFHKS